jgi:hypothetical protein
MTPIELPTPIRSVQSSNLFPHAAVVLGEVWAVLGDGRAAPRCTERLQLSRLLGRNLHAS